MNTFKTALVEIFLQPEFFSVGCNATIPGAWIARFPNGCEYAICREHEARDAKAAYDIYAARP